MSSTTTTSIPLCQQNQNQPIISSSSRLRMSKMNPRNHNLTLTIAFILTCIIMLLFFLNKTHEKLELSRASLFNVEEKYENLLKQYEALYEYKGRLESKFIEMKEKWVKVDGESETMKSELRVLKNSHRTEIQRLHDELDSCRRREELAMLHGKSPSDLLPSSSSSLVGAPPSFQLVEEVQNTSKDLGGGVKVINSLSNHYRSARQNFSSSTSSKSPIPSMDPNVDLAGNVMV